MTNTTIQTVLLQVALSFFVAIITAWVTVWLSLRRFYREKWWEAKMRAYVEIIQALHHMKRDLEISIPAEMEGRNTDTEFYKEWDAKHRAAWDEIRKNVDIGEFLFSPASIHVLRTLLQDTESDPNEVYFEHLERLQAAVDKCLPAIKATARADLRLPIIRRKSGVSTSRLSVDRRPT
jgi:hypothetical protein